MQEKKKFDIYTHEEDIAEYCGIGGAVLGGLIGFIEAGIGGAIVGVIPGWFIGGMIGYAIIPVLELCMFGGLIVFLLGLVAAAFYIIGLLWNVGKP